MATHTITIPDWLPPTLNELTRKKFRARVRLGKASANMIGVYAFACQIPHALGKRRVTLQFDHAPGRRRPDVDAYFKATLDGLVTARALKSDSPTWCELATPVLGRGKTNRTTIILEDIEPQP